MTPTRNPRTEPEKGDIVDGVNWKGMDETRIVVNRWKYEVEYRKVMDTETKWYDKKPKYCTIFEWRDWAARGRDKDVAR